MPPQLNLRKIFNPDIVFNDSIKTCWSDNIETNNKQIPLHKELKEKGVYALDIKPLQEKQYFTFCIPINKNWKVEDLSKWRDPILCFDVVGCHKFKLNVQIIDEQKAAIFKTIIDVNETEDWSKEQISITNKVNNARLVSFSGSITASNFLIKGIVLKEK